NRFYITIPGVSDDEFQGSRFLLHYNETEKCPSTTTVIDSLIGLPHVNDENHPVLQLIKKGDPAHNVLRAYSSNEKFGSTEFYSYVNKLLHDDKDAKVKNLMPFIRRATWQINKHGPIECTTVYRGMTLDEKRRSYFTPGRIFRFPGFTSTSLSKHMARNYGNTLFEIRIPPRCQQVKDISNFSCYKNEQEWLFSPYSRFQVRANQQNIIVLDAMENMI
ncbi:unnamed protein product, partial [Rotaria socialis]